MDGKIPPRSEHNSIGGSAQHHARLVSQQHSGIHASSAGSAGPPAAPGLGPDTEATVRQLISQGEYRAALDRAKEIYKSIRTPASEALLVDAYVERIRALIGRGLVVEAKALVELVRQRHPSSRKRLDELAKPSAAGSRSLEELVSALADPALPLDERTAAERVVQRKVWDLAALARCEVLPAGHGLRVGAAAIHRAFVAVTSGPVTDEELELPEVSRRSPLASWKLLVRAIAYFHRGDRASCERSIAAMDAESAPARLVPAIRAMLDEDAAVPIPPERAGAAAARRLSSAATALRAAVTRKPALVRELEGLDRAFASGSRGGILKLIRSAIEECRRESPGRLEALKQHISVRCAVADLDANRVIAAMGGPSRHDATFNQLLARAFEETHDPERLVLACAMWDEFQRAAAQEGWFAGNGPESAAVSLHIASLLEQLPEPALRELQQSPRRDAKVRGRNISFMFPDELYQRACLLDPHPEAFSRWMAWAARQPRGGANRVATVWHKIRPQDVEPILHLMGDAESRRAFGTAIRYLTKLEQIDPLRPDVQRRRLRLLAGIVVVHVRLKRTAHAIEATDRLAARAEAQQGDWPAVVAALRAVVNVLCGDAEVTAACCADVERLLHGRAAGVMLLSMVGRAAKQRALGRLGRVEDLPRAERASLPGAVARVGMLAGELRLALELPRPWIAEVARQLPANRKSLDVDELRALAELGVHVGNMHLVYAATAEGLARGRASEAVFLYLRARALAASPERSAVCARAAAELAREQQDTELVDRALALAREPFGSELFSLSLDQAREVLRQEQAASELPGPGTHEPDYARLLPQCRCVICRRRRGERVDPFDDFGLEDEVDLGIGLPPGVPPRMVEELLDAAAEAAGRGESFDSFAERVLGEGSPGRQRRSPRKRRQR